MNHGTWTRRIAFLLAAMAITATACTATETVTIDEAAVVSATSTAIRDSAGAQQGAQDSVQPDEPQANDSATDNESAATRRFNAAESGCAFTFVDSFGDIQIELAFTNPLSEQGNATAPYEVFDGNGDLLVSNTEFFQGLQPGEKVRLGVDTLTDEPSDLEARTGISCVLGEVEVVASALTGTDPGPNDSCRFIEVDSFDDIQVELTVVNPFEGSSEISVDYVLSGPDGVRFGGDSVYFEVDSGETSTVEEDTRTQFPEWVDESTFSCQILSINGF